MKPGCKVCSKARSYLPSPMRARLEKIERDRALRHKSTKAGQDELAAARKAISRVRIP